MFKVIKGKRLFEQVADEVRAAMGSGELRPGDKLPPETEMSKMFGVSRPAIREALRILELSGLIAIKKGVKGGAFVTEPLDESLSLRGYVSDRLRLGNLTIHQLTEARHSLETMVIDVASRKASRLDYNKLRASINRAEQLFKERKLEEKSGENWGFHYLLAELTKNPILIDTLSAVNEISRYLMVKIETTPEMTVRALEAHRQIVELMEGGQIELAKQVNKRHIEEVSEGLIRKCLGLPAEHEFLSQHLAEHGGQRK
jgi:DNA-binding FadR family transcriptional regulator